MGEQNRACDQGDLLPALINVDIEAVWNFRVDLLEKIEKLRGLMAFIAFVDHKSGSDVEGREQRRCAMADIRVRPAFRDDRHHWQDRLLAIKGLYLALLVDAQQPAPDWAVTDKDRQCRGPCLRITGHWKA